MMHMISTVMSIAAGLAIGYFLFEYFRNRNSDVRVERPRLHKSVQDKKIAGVCGGIAETLGVDPTLVRIAWVVLSLGWGSGVLLYFICAMIMPEGY